MDALVMTGQTEMLHVCPRLCFQYAEEIFECVLLCLTNHLLSFVLMIIFKKYTGQKVKGRYLRSNLSDVGLQQRVLVIS